MMERQISGSISIRPVRVGMVFRPDAARVRHVVELATSVWGGKYYPWLSPHDTASVLALADSLSVDVLHALDDDPASLHVTQRDGYRWEYQWGSPFEFPQNDLMDARLLGTEWLLDDPRQYRYVLPEWDPTDPLDALFSVWYGRFGASPYEQYLASRFAAVADQATIGTNDAVPDWSDRVTPIGLTSLEVNYGADHRSLAVIVVDAQDPADLAYFWTARAAGQQVFPWPVGFEHRISQVARAWLQRALSTDSLGRARSGDGADQGPVLAVLSRALVPVPDELAVILRELGIEGYVSVWHPDPYRGPHPFRTPFVKEFSLTVDSRHREVALPMPPAGPPRWQPDRHHIGIVAAHITFGSESVRHADLVGTLPDVRDLAALLTEYCNVPEPFNRPARGGRALGIRADTQDVGIRLVPSPVILERLLANSPWTPTLTENGRSVSRLINMLGPFGKGAGNEPATRAVLHAAARSPHGLVFQQMESEADKAKGAWPGPFCSPDDRRTYPRRVVHALLSRDLLRAVLPIRCPQCAAHIDTVPPHRLPDRVECDQCGLRSTLAYAVAAAGQKSNWKYRLAEDISDAVLTQTWPIMASLSVLATYHQPLIPSMSNIFGITTTMSHLLGVEFHSSGGVREIDVVAMLDDGDRPVIIVGEAKGGLNTRNPGNLINQNDLDLLTDVQTQLRAGGIECFILAATMRSSFEDDEISALRGLCTAPPASARRGCIIEPVLPIVLTGPDLSTPRFTDDHPSRWGCPHRGIAGLAMESCRRNLDLR